MNKQNLNELVKKAAKQHPKKDSEKAPEFVLTGYWEKGNTQRTSWLAKVIGVTLKADDKGVDREILDLQFGTKESPICFAKFEWLTEKEDPNKKAFISWHLKDGIYKAHTIKDDKDTKGTYHLFAVCEGNRTDLSEEAVISIMNQGGGE